MKTRAEAIAFCMKQTETYEDRPFHDSNWSLIRHKGNKKVFAWIFEKDGNICSILNAIRSGGISGEVLISRWYLGII
ncbi:hypothetical protein [Clostridium sp. E02]|uniref:hypothetical protein n=1 Tax=Clostridium sp. E02 TaxID=2487134 RepID=UPI00325C059F